MAPDEDVSEPAPTPEQIDAWITGITELKAAFKQWLKERAGGAAKGGAR